MGKTEQTITKLFTFDNVLDKNLVIKMLQYEDTFGKGNEGQKIFSTKVSLPQTTLQSIYAIHICVLTHFGFDTTSMSVENYRTIFKTYYESLTKYDSDVTNSGYYMKNNLCVFYKLPKPKIGNHLTDCNLLQLYGTVTTLFNMLNQLEFNKCIIGAFSNR